MELSCLPLKLVTFLKVRFCEPDSALAKSGRGTKWMSFKPLIIPCCTGYDKRLFFMPGLMLLLLIQPVMAGQLSDFSSDGCSQFPDGTLSQRDLWCSCCITHDIAYWQGGSSLQKKQADAALRQCVLEKTESQLLADTMYYGVTLGGSPVYPVWYRWGYGWAYGRGFQTLSNYDKQKVDEKLQQYYVTTSQSFCDFEHPLKLLIKKEVQEILD